MRGAYNLLRAPGRRGGAVRRRRVGRDDAPQLVRQVTAERRRGRPALRGDAPRRPPPRAPRLGGRGARGGDARARRERFAHADRHARRRDGLQPAVLVGARRPREAALLPPDSADED